MRPSVPVLAIVLFAALAARVPAQTLSDSEKVALVFPFKVGQQYQFKSSGNFYQLVHGAFTVWPADSVAEVSITDTVAGGKTYLHVPFWSPFGSAYYRLDDSMRIWMGGGDWWETPFVDLRLAWLAGYVGYCPFNDGYREVFAHPCGMNVFPCAAFGWTNLGDTTTYRMTVLPLGLDWSVDVFHGAYGRGSSLHATGHCLGGVSGNPPACTYELGGLWGLFRPKSDAPWPKFARVVGVREGKELCCQKPSSLRLWTFPNPFNATVTIRFAIPEPSPTRVAVYTITGQLVRMIVDGRVAAGMYTVVWDGKDHSGRSVASGLYVARLSTGKSAVATRLTLVR